MIGSMKNSHTGLVRLLQERVRDAISAKTSHVHMGIDTTAHAHNTHAEN